MKAKDKAVITRNRSEFVYMRSWCEDNGKGSPFMGEPESYPFMICVGCDGLAGWIDRMDRNIEYVEFVEFVK